MDIIVSILLTIVFVIGIGLSVFGAFWWINMHNKNKTSKEASDSNVQCDIKDCNAIMKVWIEMEKSKDFTNSSAKFKECKGCPQRGFKREKLQVMKDNKWVDYIDSNDAYDKIKI